MPRHPLSMVGICTVWMESPALCRAVAPGRYIPSGPSMVVSVWKVWITLGSTPNVAEGFDGGTTMPVKVLERPGSVARFWLLEH